MHGITAGVPAKALRIPARPSYATRVAQCIFTSAIGFALHSIAVRIPTPDFGTYVLLSFCPSVCTKEVIRLQVPLQPPCYDFSPLA